MKTGRRNPFDSVLYEIDELTAAVHLSSIYQRRHRLLSWSSDLHSMDTEAPSRRVAQTTPAGDGRPSPLGRAVALGAAGRGERGLFDFQVARWGPERWRSGQASIRRVAVFCRPSETTMAWSSANGRTRYRRLRERISSLRASDTATARSARDRRVMTIAQNRAGIFPRNDESPVSSPFLPFGERSLPALLRRSQFTCDRPPSTPSCPSEWAL